MTALAFLFVLAFAAPADAQTPDGAMVFSARCASCHRAAGESRAPTIDALKDRSPESIVDSLTGGAMRYQGLALSGAERRAVAEHITGKTLGTRSADPMAGRCRTPPSRARRKRPPLTAAQLSNLTLKWAFGFPDATSAWSRPTVAGTRLFVGSQNGFVYALDAERGCVLWAFEARGGVRAAVSVDTRRAYFVDQVGYAYAVDVTSGRLIWTRQVDDHPLVRLTGSPLLFAGRLYVPTSSYEEAGKPPDYPCCTFRGSLVALDARSGAIVWKSFVIDEAPRVLGKNTQGIESLGPSGGAIWSAPIVDVKRRRIYAGTGNTYSGSAQPATDAIVAFDLASGRKVWSKQLHADDVFGCRPGEPNCGARPGPDFDFGASPILTKLPSGRDALIAGQKSGIGYALDPDDNGAVLWEYRAGRGGPLGGIEWGIAVDAEHAYFPVADVGAPQPGGLHAVKLATGERAWVAPPISALLCGPSTPGNDESLRAGRPARGCTAAQSAAITVIPGAVLSGAFDGGLRAYSTHDGSVVWEFDTNREFLTINQVPAKGGSLNGPAPVVAGGILLISSGDYRGRPGNVLLALAID